MYAPNSHTKRSAHKRNTIRIKHKIANKKKASRENEKNSKESKRMSGKDKPSKILMRIYTHREKERG